MTDQNSQFFAILTAVGEAKQANANALGVPWTFAQMGVGDANGTDPVPSRTQTKLINERRRAALNQVKVDPGNASIIIAEQVIPPDVGGWWIREIGLYDAAGDLVAVANCAPSFKPLLAQGTGKTQVVRLNIVVTSTANIQLKIDPAVVLATREYVDTRIVEYLPATRPAGTYTKVTINERGIVTEGSSPTTLGGYGITDAIKSGSYGLAGKTTAVSEIDNVALPGGFHAYTSGATTLANYVSVLHFPYTVDTQAAQLGFKFAGAEPQIFVRSTKGPSEWGSTRELWHSGNFTPGSKADKAITLAGYGITDAHTKTEIAALLIPKAPLASPGFTGVPTAPTPAALNNSTQVATTAFVQTAVANLIAAAPGALDTLAELAAAMGNDPNFAATITNALTLKAPLASPTFTGQPKVPTAAVGTNTTQAASTAFVVSELAALLADPWSFQPIGVPIPVFDGASGGLVPPKGKAYRYIRLTAADAYNDDLLTGEVVSGSAPLLSAHATVNLAGSLLHNSIVRLINTERRFLRAGSVSTVENDQLQGFTLPAGTGNGSGGAAFDIWVNGAVNATKTPVVTDGVNGTPRIGNETRPKNVGVTYYMRIY
ncbi:phage tail protein [Pseudomonas soli]|uniref:Phage tail protein n=1 Tax=Pseudomonas soli TaxID=1306993 RepID=A0ABU7GWB6_9PSED|nr:phage tail protein [Pseudomonas soli]MEE1883344.1 phage tail protein [Pseudomonas soli]